MLSLFMDHEFLKMNNVLPPTELYSIEKMKLSHLPAVLAIERKSFPQPWSYSLFVSEFSNRFAHYLVIRIRKRIIGYIGFWTLLDEAHITTFAIHPEYRGQGYGKKLFLYTLATLEKIGCRDILLEVRTSNLIARKLYQSLGFISYGVRKNYYSDGEDALLMKKTIIKKDEKG